MDEKELENINQIDMECNVDVDDFDDDFGSVTFNAENSKQSDESIIDESEDRPLQRKTGIIIDLSDDDDVDIKSIAVKDKKESNKNNAELDLNLTEAKDYNEIDMETTSCEDDDDDVSLNIEEGYGLILDEPKTKKSSYKVTFGEVEDDYWDKLQKKHAKSNKPGAYNASFHFAGNPELERELFNKGNGATKPTPAIDNDEHEGEITSISSEASASEGSISAGSGEASGSMGEKISKSSKKSLFEDILKTIDFKIMPLQKHGYKIIDECDIVEPKVCRTMNEVADYLKPFLEDCYTTALEVNTGESFSNFADWIKWYSGDKVKEYPQCKNDIEACKIICNELKPYLMSLRG